MLPGAIFFSAVQTELSEQARLRNALVERTEQETRKGRHILAGTRERGKRAVSHLYGRLAAAAEEKNQRAPG
jgi:hypothetical protein